jgi:ABC-2 type transport system permease protein
MNSEIMTSAKIAPASAAPLRVNPLLPAFTLWWREVVRFYRQPARVVGVVASPLLFWVVIGAGFGTSLQKGATGTGNFLQYFFPGALMMIVLFTSIFTMMSVIEDRNEGFLLSVMVAPVHRSGIVLGKVLGGTTLSAIQGLVFLVFAPFIGVKIDVEQFLIVALVTFLVAFSLTALGFVIAWRMESSQGFHAIINLFLIPLWMLSGALFPVSGASHWVQWLMRLNPLTYGMDALLLTLFPATAPATTLPLWPSIGVLAIFAGVVFAAGFAVANRRRTLPAA